MFAFNYIAIAIVLIYIWSGTHSGAVALRVFPNLFNVRNDVIFEMYTKSNGSEKLTLSQLDHQQNGRVARSIRNFAFDYRRPTRIFVHGFLSKRDTLDMYPRAYLAAGDFNLIVVNWLKGAVTLSYSRARNRVKLVSGLLNKNTFYVLCYSSCCCCWCCYCCHFCFLSFILHSAGLFIFVYFCLLFTFFFDCQLRRWVRPWLVSSITWSLNKV